MTADDAADLTVGGPAAPAGPPSRLRFWRYLRRDRVAAAVTGCLLIAAVAVVVGTAGGAHALLPGFTDAGAWLANRGSVTHANGLSGQVDAQVTITGADGHTLVVHQDGGTVLVQDLNTGVVSRIDPAQLTVTQSSSLSAAGVQVAVGHGLAYVVDPKLGYVQRIDPRQLTAIGGPLVIGAPLGAAAIDGNGLLWVPKLATGQVVPVSVAGVGVPVPVAGPGDPQQITIANGTVAVTDPARSTLTTVGPGGVGRTVSLPAGSSPALTPDTTDGSVVPIVLNGPKQLVLVDTQSATPTTVAFTGVGDDELGSAQTLGNRVYVPDNTTGRLIVYDAQRGSLLNQIPVTTHHPAALTMFVKDGILYVNDAGGPDAIAVDATGAAHPIGKYGNPQNPGGGLPSPGHASAPGDSPGHRPGPGGGNGSGSGPGSPGQGGGHASRTPTPTPTTPAPITQPPGSVQERPEAGSILVTFTPVGAPAPTGYTITGLPPGANPDPAEVPAGGPYQVRVGGGMSCGQSYAFTVVAHYPSGPKQATGAPARPCVPPGTPGQLAVSPTDQHQLTASWDPATGGGGRVAYAVSWGSGTSPPVAGTSFTINGLTNFDTYTVGVRASNEAGSGPATSKAVPVSPGRTWPGVIYNNALWPVNVRAEPTTASASKGSFAAPGGEGVSVVCEVTHGGGAWVDPSNSPSGNTWFKVTYPGYIATGYVNVHGAPVWACD